MEAKTESPRTGQNDDIESKIKAAMSSDIEAKVQDEAPVDFDLEPDMTFTLELRKATKDVHKISDKLVNAKFAFALSDDAVWVDALLAFHELYKYFEKHLPEELLPKELHRTDAFEKDLAYFLGDNWKDTYEPRDSVKRCLTHLDEIRAKSDLHLFAYAFQMYMALMSGGQLLQKKRMIARKLWIFGKNDEAAAEEKPAVGPNVDPDDLQSRPMPTQVNICPPGCASTYFPEKISVLKAKLRTILNKQCAKFDDQMRAEFIEESRNVFIFNSEIVRSVKDVNKTNLRKIAVVAIAIIGVYLAVKFGLKNF